MDAVFTVSSQGGWSSLMVASQNGHVEVVDKLLQHGATVDLQDNVCNATIHNKINYALFLGFVMYDNTKAGSFFMQIHSL